MEELRMFLNGTGMSGGSVNHTMVDARFIGPARTAPRYRFYAVRDEFPGLHPVADGGVAVVGELYAVTYEILRERLLPVEPPELELGVIELDDGSGTLSMRMRADALGAEGVVDISDHGGWRAYLAAKR
jgi:gamma-glutamylcyclotransferase (GGCT)/AIG2-like uncharacterized protein YtfP